MQWLTFNISNLYPTLWVIVMAFMFAACSIDDDRDECCDEVNTIRFRYLYKGSDCYSDYINSVEYFLFESNGNFIQEVENMEGALNKVDINNYPAGDYVLVALANLRDYGYVEGHAVEGLSAFRLAVDKFDSRLSGTFGNGDPLYWGECHFSVTPGCSINYLAEMSNIHCVLRIAVEWEGLPDFNEGYWYSLDGIGTGMEMHGGNASQIDVQKFPPIENYQGKMVRDADFKQQMLYGEMITLRWTDNDIPIFRLHHDNDTVTGAFHLKELFDKWNWHPERAQTQKYEIKIILNRNGTAEFKQGISAEIADWTDGGHLQ